MPNDAGFICPHCGLPQGDPRCPHQSHRGSAVPGLGASTLGPGRGLFASPGLAPPPGSPAPPAPAARADASPQPIDVGAKIVPEGDFKITSLGFEGCGKTTYIGMLYFLLACGHFPGYRFAWSDSLRELETIRSALYRPGDQGGPTFPPRTSREKTLFLHLGLRRWEDDRYVDVYFPEFSGEDVAQVWTTGQFAPSLSFLADMNAYMVFLDATAVGMTDLGRAQVLFQSLLGLKKTKWLTDPVAIVLAKWDAVAGPSDAITPEEFVREKLAGLSEMWEGTLARYRLFGVSSVGDVRKVLGRDGRPVKGASGEELAVPAPERGEEDGTGAIFRYRPRNVSRPLVWLLSELMGAKGAAP